MEFTNEIVELDYKIEMGHFHRFHPFHIIHHLINTNNTSNTNNTNNTSNTSNINKYKTLLQSQDVKNYLDKDGNSILHFLYIHCKNIPFFTIALESDMDINIQNSCGNTILHLITYDNNILFLELLVEHSKKSGKININLQNNIGYTPLHISIFNEYNVVTELLLQYDLNANINCKDSYGYSPFYYSVINNNEKIIKLLLQRYIEIDNDLIIINHNIFISLMHVVCFHNNICLLHFFMRHKINPNILDTDGNSPLHFSCIFRNIEAARILLEFGADPCIQNKNGNSALHYLIKPLSINSIIKSLVDSNFYKMNDIYTKSSIKNLLSYNQSDSEYVKLLLQYGANIFTENNCKLSSLYFAIAYNHSYMINIFVEKHMNLNIVNSIGISPIQYSIIVNNYDVFIYLYRHGAEIEKHDLYSFLHISVYYSNSLQVELLLGIYNVNDIDKYGQTALEVACRKNDIDMIQFLLSKKAVIRNIHHLELLKYMYRKKDKGVFYQDIKHIRLSYTISF
jgi:ankyrin repeat protein